MAPEESGTFLRPFLHALARVHQREVLQLNRLEREAGEAFTKRFGDSGDRIQTASASGHVALFAEHTYYFDGFGLALPIPYGTAIAMCPVEPGDAFCFFEREHQDVPLTREAAASEKGPAPTRAPTRDRLVKAIASRYGPAQVCVVSNIPECCADGDVAALTVAWERAAGEGNDGERSSTDTVELAALISDAVGRPFGVAPILVARHAVDGEALLLDARTKGHLGLKLPPRDLCIFGVIDVKREASHPPEVFTRRKRRAAEAIRRITVPGMPAVESFRDLEHRHLVAAVAQLPQELQPVTRYLVSENRRVQRAVTAIRKQDMQIVGGHLLMSQASLRTDWNEVNDVVEQVRTMAEHSEGVHGIRRTGKEFGTAVLVLGQPLAVAQLFEALERKEHPSGVAVETMLL